MKHLIGFLGNLNIFALIGGSTSALFGIIGSGLICALLLGLSAITDGSVVVHNLQHTFTSIAIVIGCLVAIFSIFEYRDMWRINQASCKNT
jgi:hypothetical protein